MDIFVLVTFALVSFRELMDNKSKNYKEVFQAKIQKNGKLLC